MFANIVSVVYLAVYEHNTSVCLNVYLLVCVNVVLFIIYLFIFKLDIAQYLQCFYCALHKSTHLRYIQIVYYLHINVK